MSINLKNMQILAAFRLGYIAQADFLQNFFSQMKRQVSAGIAHFARCPGSSRRFFVALLFQADLLENANEQFVDVVLDAGRSFDKLRAAALGKRGSFCVRKIKNIKFTT